MSAHRADDARKAQRALISLVILAVVAGGATVAVRAAYGAFSDDVLVHSRFERAGQALRTGSDVKYRGVNVGKVRSLDLRDRGVDVVLQLQRSARVPKATTATVRAKTVFGEKYVELATVDGDPAPFLRDGDEVASGGVGTEVEDLIDSTDHLLAGVDADELATLMRELVDASQGEGERVAEVIDRGVEAGKVVVDTLDAQLDAIDSFARFAHEYRDIGPSLNATNRNLDELLPTFAAAREDYERLLATLRPFADHLAELIRVNEADLDQLLDDGDNIVRVLTARKAEIAQTLRGLDHYTETLADAIAPGTLPDGSRYGNMKIFVDLGDLQALLCQVLGPSSAGDPLAQVRAALAERAPMLACPGDPAPTGGGGTTPAVPPLGQPAGEPDPVTELISQLATPDLSTNDGTVGDVLAPLLGGAG